MWWLLVSRWCLGNIPCFGRPGGYANRTVCFQRQINNDGRYFCGKKEDQNAKYELYFDTVTGDLKFSFHHIKTPKLTEIRVEK